MLFSRFYRLRTHWHNLAMRLSWNQLPVLSTHGATFLLGTLFLRSAPDLQKPMPQQLLFPAEKFFKDGRPTLGKGQAFHLAKKPKEGQEFCLLSDEPLRLWTSPLAHGQRYLAIPPRKQSEALLQILLGEGGISLVSAAQKLSPCREGTSIAYD